MAFIFPYIGNKVNKWLIFLKIIAPPTRYIYHIYIYINHPNWLIFFRGIETTNQYIQTYSYWTSYIITAALDQSFFSPFSDFSVTHPFTLRQSHHIMYHVWCIKLAKNITWYPAKSMFVPYKSVIWVCLEMGYTSYKNREIVDKLWDGIFWATLFSDKHIYIYMEVS